jgi:adenylyl-sulfate kinase
MTTGPGFTLWFTGLPGSGKSTLARAAYEALAGAGHRAEILDGDEVRRKLSAGLGFSRQDRDENVRRIGFVARLLARNGVIAIAAVVSPYRETRDEIRRAHEAPFVEVFVDCPVDDLIRRDPKGLYARALRGELPNLTGIGDPYEPPIAPDVHVSTNTESVNESLSRVMAGLVRRGLATPPGAEAVASSRYSVPM